MAKNRADQAVRLSSGNVFADLKLPRPDELKAKAELVLQMLSVISQKRLTQSKAAKLMGIDQPKVSALFNGNFSGFSTDRLFRLLTRLGADIEISVKMRGSHRGHGEVRVLRHATVKTRSTPG